MNKKLILIGLVLTLLGCAAVKQSDTKGFTMEHKFVTQNGMNIPILTNEKDKAPSLDVIRQKVEQEAFMPRNGKQPEFLDPEVVGRPVTSYFTEIINDSLTVECRVNNIHGDYVSQIIEYVKETQNHRDDLGEGFYYRYRNTEEFYYRYKTIREYYPNGQLKWYQVWFDAWPDRDIRLGTWYRFDEEGNLLQTIDHEKYFKTTYLEVLKIALSYNRNYFLIRRDFSEDKSYWRINLRPIDNEPKPNINIVIDGQTGKVIDEYEMDQYPGRYLQLHHNDEYSKKLYENFRRLR